MSVAKALLIGEASLKEDSARMEHEEKVSRLLEELKLKQGRVLESG
jgi:hypothetical protein